jgi:hypothetical protein
LFLLPFSGGAVQYLADLLPAMSAPAVLTYLPTSGGTVTGPITLAGDPVSALQAVTKQYVDALIPVPGWP